MHWNLYGNLWTPETKSTCHTTNATHCVGDNQIFFTSNPNRKAEMTIIYMANFWFRSFLKVFTVWFVLLLDKNMYGKIEWGRPGEFYANLILSIPRGFCPFESGSEYLDSWWIWILRSKTSDVRNLCIL